MSYDIKVYENGEEQETIRGLTESQKQLIIAVLHRHHIKFKVNFYARAVELP